MQHMDGDARKFAASETTKQQQNTLIVKLTRYISGGDGESRLDETYFDYGSSSGNEANECLDLRDEECLRCAVITVCIVIFIVVVFLGAMVWILPENKDAEDALAEGDKRKGSGQINARGHPISYNVHI